MLGSTLDFTPTKDFFCDENQTHYVKGLGYTATTEALKNLVEQWASQGLVVLSRTRAQVAGTGIVE
jgi:hypothetical protein